MKSAGSPVPFILECQHVQQLNNFQQTKPFLFLEILIKTYTDPKKKRQLHLYVNFLQTNAFFFFSFNYFASFWLQEMRLFGLRQTNLVLIVYASSEGSGEPAHPRSLTRTSAARSYKQ